MQIYWPDIGFMSLAIENVKNVLNRTEFDKSTKKSYLVLINKRTECLYNKYNQESKTYQTNKFFNLHII